MVSVIEHGDIWQANYARFCVKVLDVNDGAVTYRILDGGRTDIKQVVVGTIVELCATDFEQRFSSKIG